MLYLVPNEVSIVVISSIFVSFFPVENTLSVIYLVPNELSIVIISSVFENIFTMENTSATNNRY